MLESDLKDEIKRVRNNRCAFSCVFVSQVYKTKKVLKNLGMFALLKASLLGFIYLCTQFFYFPVQFLAPPLTGTW